MAENENRTFRGLRCCCCSAGNTSGEMREKEGGPQALGPSGPAQPGLRLPSQPQAVMLPFDPALEEGERGKRQEKLPPPGIPTPGKHSWRVLEAPGSPVVSEMLLASRSH